jgi:pimeloyl-ACP methyl ester carboxylesterase
MAQPIVIMGGFLSFPALYRGMRQKLVELAGQPVWVVQAFVHDWMLAVAPIGWKRLLDRLQHTVRQALSRSSTAKVTLVGHSSGGVVARLYLSAEPFLGISYRGLEHVDQLITLGSPHHNERGTRMRHWVDEEYPGAYFSPQVGYTSVAGRAVQGNRHGSFRERCAFLFYRRLCGDGNAWGDGLVPEESALLRGSRQISLDGVSHFAGIVGLWYGADEVISRWWSADDRTPSEPEGFKRSAGPDTRQGAGDVRGGSLD